MMGFVYVTDIISVQTKKYVLTLRGENMKYQEVENLFFDYEEKKHDFIQKAQKYFIERGFAPYVWFDDKHNLRVKYKHMRQSPDDSFPLKQRQELVIISEKYAEENDLKIRFILDLCETDNSLRYSTRTQWSTELIFEVKK